MTEVGAGVAVALGVAVAEAVGDGDAGVTEDEPEIAHDPAVDVQAVGAVKAPLSVMPMVADAPGASAAFHDRFVAVRRPPARLPVAFHMLMLLPDHGMLTDQPFTAVVPVFVTVRSTLRPVPQSEVTFTPTVTAALEAGVLVEDELGDAVGVGAVVAVEDGETDGVTVGVDEAVGAGVVAVEGAPTTEQEPAGMRQVVGERVPPRGAPRNPNVVEAPLASEVLQLGPVNRYPPVVAVLVASQTEVIAFAYGTVTDHGLIARPELLMMRTEPWYPVPQSWLMVHSTETSAVVALAPAGSATASVDAVSVASPRPAMSLAFGRCINLSSESSEHGKGEMWPVGRSLPVNG